MLLLSRFCLCYLFTLFSRKRCCRTSHASSRQAVRHKSSHQPSQLLVCRCELQRCFTLQLQLRREFTHLDAGNKQSVLGKGLSNLRQTQSHGHNLCTVSEQNPVSKEHGRLVLPHPGAVPSSLPSHSLGTSSLKSQLTFSR